MLIESLIVYSLIFIGIIGSGVAGYIDLKTTEVPDSIPIAMMVLGILLRLSYSILTGQWDFVIQPIFVFLLFGGFGALLYYAGQWGGADAEMMGVMGFLIGFIPKSFYNGSIFPFWLDYFFNFFIVAGVYSISYAIIISILNPKVSKGFFKDLEESRREILIFLLISFTVILVISYFTGNYKTSILSGGLVFSVYVLFKFLKNVEERGFKRRISTKKLKAGDMLDEEIPELGLSGKLIKGLTEEEVKNIKRLRKTVFIKEGIRSVIVFCISLIVTLLWGNIMIHMIWAM